MFLVIQNNSGFLCQRAKIPGKEFEIYCKLPLAFLGVGYYIDFISTQSQ